MEDGEFVNAGGNSSAFYTAASLRRDGRSPGVPSAPPQCTFHPICGLVQRSPGSSCQPWDWTSSVGQPRTTAAPALRRGFVASGDPAEKRSPWRLTRPSSFISTPSNDHLFTASNNMAAWIDAKSHLHLFPRRSCTSFSEAYRSDLEPGMLCR